MQIVSEVMTRNVQYVRPQESVQRAAQMMDELNIGALPVCDGERLVGMITDRDITVRSTSVGQSPQEARVEQVMSSDVRWCFEDQPLDEVMQQMSDTQIRRVPVVSHDDVHKLVGIVALGDVATKTAPMQKRAAEETMEKISSPSEPDRSTRASGKPDTSVASAVSRATGSDTGTASGFAGSEMTDMDAGTGEAISTAGSASTANAAGAAGSAGPTGAERTDAGAAGVSAGGTWGSSGGTAGGVAGGGGSTAKAGKAGQAGKTKSGKQR